MTYSCEIPAYAIRAGEEVLAFRLPTVDFGTYDVGAQERNLPFTHTENYHGEKYIEIEIPDGYEIEYLPESVDLDIGYESFKATITVDGGVLKYSQISEGDFRRILAPEDYPEYKKFIEDKSKFSEKWILVKKI